MAGFLLAAPVIGNALVLFREDAGSRMVTTPVLRVMGSDRVIFIETENSLYRLEVHGQVVYRDQAQRFVPLATREVRLHLGSSRAEEPLSRSDRLGLG